jgi:NADPH:quinone reductase-like Zn-dependent oxidoreductase
VLEGAKVITTAGSAAKCDACMKLGATRAVNYKEEDFVAAVAETTQGHGVDVILDMVGGQYAKRNLESIAPDGRLVHIASGSDFSTPLLAVSSKRAIVTASQMRPLPLPKKQRVVDDLLARVWPHLGTRIHTVIDNIYPLEQAAQSHARMESSQHIGKILLAVNP